MVLAMLGAFCFSSEAMAQIQVIDVTWGQGALPVEWPNGCSAGEVIPNGNLTASAASKCNGQLSCSFNLVTDTDLNGNGIKGQFPGDDPAYGCSKPLNNKSYTCLSDGIVRNALFDGGLTLTMACPVVTVFASGISPVIAWDPIFPDALVSPDYLESKPVPTVGYDDPRWANPHAASVFAKNSHVWEYAHYVPSAFKFDANWINAWANLASNGVGGPGQSWTKYSTTITGTGDFVLQFLADNASWIYIDGELVGFQDYNWQSNGTGRYTIRLTGAGPHELSFIIWDGGGLAGGKFRIETVQSFQENNPGEELPPPPPPSDVTPPVISVPENITVEATRPDGAFVPFTATATDDVDGPVAVVANPASNSLFALGTTTVDLSAVDAASNGATASFTVTVQDTIAPAITSVPADQIIEATSAAGAMATFGAAEATDAVGVVSLTYSHPSGSTFAIGTTTVIVTAKDAAGNSSQSTFSVTVEDTTPPVITSVSVNLTAEATSAAGASVSYAAATATDAVGASLTYSHASGSMFALGTTTVTVTAKDAAGNSSQSTFGVTVVDTTAPVITSTSGNLTAEATSADGAVVTYDAAAATDAVGPVSITYSKASGATFALSTTTVTVTATDAFGNASSAQFVVTVHDTTAPVMGSVTPSQATLWPPNHKMVAVTVSASASDLVGVTSLKIISATSSEPDNGLGDGDTAGDIQVTGDLTLNLRAERSGKGNGRTYTITVEARDAAGNASTKTCTVFVPKSQGK